MVCPVIDFFLFMCIQYGLHGNQYILFFQFLLQCIIKPLLLIMRGKCRKFFPEYPRLCRHHHHMDIRVLFCFPDKLLQSLQIFGNLLRIKLFFCIVFQKVMVLSDVNIMNFIFAHKQFHVCLERNPMIPSGKLIPQIRFIFFLESSIQNFRYTYFRACLKFSFFNRRIGSLMRQCFFSCQAEEKHHKNHPRQPFEYPYHNFLYLYSLLMAFTAFSFCFLYAAITLSSDCSSCLLLIVPSMIKHT